MRVRSRTARSIVCARSTATLPSISPSILSAAAPISRRQNRFFAQRLLQHRVVAAFIFAAKNDQDSSRKCIQRLQRRVDIRRLGIVVVAHAVDFGDKFEAVFDTCKAADSCRNRRHRRRPPASWRRQRPEHSRDCERPPAEFRRGGARCGLRPSIRSTTSSPRRYAPCATRCFRLNQYNCGFDGA